MEVSSFFRFMGCRWIGAASPVRFRPGTAARCGCRPPLSAAPSGGCSSLRRSRACSRARAAGPRDAPRESRPPGRAGPAPRSGSSGARSHAPPCGDRRDRVHRPCGAEVWPSIDLIDVQGISALRRPNTLCSALASVRSLSSVPVPWAQIRVDVAGNRAGHADRLPHAGGRPFRGGIRRRHAAGVRNDPMAADRRQGRARPRRAAKSSAFHDQHGAAFAEDEAVAVAIERTDQTSGVDVAHYAETGAGHLGHRVEAPGDDHVGLVRAQQVTGDRQSEVGRRACGREHQVGAEKARFDAQAVARRVHRVIRQLGKGGGGLPGPAR